MSECGRLLIWEGHSKKTNLLLTPKAREIKREGRGYREVKTRIRKENVLLVRKIFHRRVSHKHVVVALIHL